jgi:hypothetical protein
MNIDTFYFSRLNHVKKKNLWKLLSAGHIYTINQNDSYGFFDLETIKDKELGVIYSGLLIKYVAFKSENVVKEGKMDIAYIKDSIQAQCRFFLTKKDHILIYNPYGNIVNREAFQKYFMAILSLGDDSFESDNSIFPINTEHDFFKFLKTEMKTLSKLTISLTPSNPNPNPDWDKVDDKLNKMNLKSYKEVLVAKDGQSIDLQDEERQKISMANDGYGKAVGSGLDQDGLPIKISTDKNENVLSKQISKGIAAIDQLNVFKRIITDIRKRFEKKQK